MDNRSSRAVCESGKLLNSGDGVRFSVVRAGELLPAFVVRYDDVPRAFINACVHRGVELDWEQGRFFDFTGRALICSTHGARYEPVNGRCVGGPCQGGLTPLNVVEADGQVWLVTEDGLDLG